MGLRTTDNLNLDPRDRIPAFAGLENLGPLSALPEDVFPATMQSLIQLFREKTDQQIATLIPGTTADKAADIRSMLKNAGLL